MMIDMGKKNSMPCAIDGEDMKNKKSYPSLYVPLELVKGKTVGDMCRIEIVAKVVGLREDEATLDVHKAEYKGKAGKATKEEYKEMTDDERDAHDKMNMDMNDSEDKEDDSE